MHRTKPSVRVYMHIFSFSPASYSPLYLPLVATVVLDLVSLSTSIVAGAPVHVLRMVLDGAYLLLTATKSPPTTTFSSSSPYPLSSSGSRSSSVCSSSVCVVELEWLELTLRHCDSALLNKEVQKVSTWLMLRL